MTHPPLTALATPSRRLYDIYPIVEMNYERRGDGYASLGSYFDGQNSGLVKFAYTQPVFMRYEPVSAPMLCDDDLASVCWHTYCNSIGWVGAFIKRRELDASCVCITLGGLGYY